MIVRKSTLLRYRWVEGWEEQVWSSAAALLVHGLCAGRHGLASRAMVNLAVLFADVKEIKFIQDY